MSDAASSKVKWVGSPISKDRHSECLTIHCDSYWSPCFENNQLHIFIQFYRLYRDTFFDSGA